MDGMQVCGGFCCGGEADGGFGVVCGELLYSEKLGVSGTVWDAEELCDGLSGVWGCLNEADLLMEGRWRKGSGAGFLFRFQNVRSPKHSAGTLWHRPGAAPSSPWLTASS